MQTKKKKPIHTSYHLGTERLLLTDQEKDLGIIMHHKLAWQDHIITKVNTANKILHLMRRTCGKLIQTAVIRKLYIHLVRPHLGYACEVWSPHQAFLQDMIGTETNDQRQTLQGAFTISPSSFPDVQKNSVCCDLFV